MTKRVTIGIPAYNEEKTLRHVVDRVLEQQGDFRIEKILIVCDGSTDSTVSVAHDLTLRDNRISVIFDGNRVGKAERLNQIFLLNKSEILFLLDADITLSNDKVFSLMLRHFEKKEVGLVSANNLPISSTSFWSKLMYANEMLWYHARKNYKNGDNIYNNTGVAVAVTSAFVQEIRFPQGTIEDQHFLYMYCKNGGREFVFEKDAKVFYRTISSYEDFVKQLHRSSGAEDLFYRTFKQNLNSVSAIPLRNKISAVITLMRKDPFFTFAAIILVKIFDCYPRSRNLKNQKFNLWEPTYSTKLPIHL